MRYPTCLNRGIKDLESETRRDNFLMAAVSGSPWTRYSDFRRFSSGLHLSCIFLHNSCMVLNLIAVSPLNSINLIPHSANCLPIIVERSSALTPLNVFNF